MAVASESSSVEAAKAEALIACRSPSRVTYWGHEHLHFTGIDQEGGVVVSAVWGSGYKV